MTDGPLTAMAKALGIDLEKPAWSPHERAEILRRMDSFTNTTGDNDMSVSTGIKHPIHEPVGYAGGQLDPGIPKSSGIIEDSITDLMNRAGTIESVVGRLRVMADRHLGAEPTEMSEGRDEAKTGGVSTTQGLRNADIRIGVAIDQLLRQVSRLEDL